MPRRIRSWPCPLATRLGQTLAAAVMLGGAVGPSCSTPAPDDALLLVDQNAGTGHGAVFVLEPGATDPRLLLTSPLFDQPQDVLVEPDGSFLVLDYYKNGGVGKVFRFDADGKNGAEVPMPDGLVDPYQFERADDGSIWIVDKNADPLNLGKGGPTGTLWRWSADRKTLTPIASGPPLAAPSGLLFADGEAYLMDADAFRTEPYDLRNAEGGIFRVRPHPQALETVVRFQQLVSPLGMHRNPDGTFLVVDVNADPVERSRIRGAIYKVDPKSGTTTLFANHDDFRDPVTCLAWDGALLVTDANADPLNLGPDGSTHHFAGRGRGGIYRVDLGTGKVTLFMASKHFVNPLRLRRWRR